MVYSPHPVRVGKEPRHLAVTTQRRRGDIAVTLTEERVAEDARLIGPAYRASLSPLSLRR